MGFKIDILIIYATADNQQEANSGEWITDFRRFLELMMIKVHGKKPNILLKSDQDVLTGTNLEEVATLIPILSKAFIASKTCLEILEAFQALSANPRIFKVLKQPLARVEQPEQLRDRPGFEFYKTNIDIGDTTDYKDFFGPEAEQDFWMKMVDLAYDIHERLLLLKEKNAKSETRPGVSARTIYLAETSHELAMQRNIIKRELQRNGNRVLPGHPLPKNLDDLKKVVKKDIEESSLSIHLIGSSYGDIPLGSDRSVVDIQNQMAAEKNAEIKNKSQFSRLVWITPHLDYAGKKQKTFVETIKREIASTQEAEVLQTSLEDFKNIVREELMEIKLNKVRPPVDNGTDGRTKVYVLYDQLDEKEVEPIKKFVQQSGYDLLVPIFGEEQVDLRQHHITNLQNLDAAIVFQGKVNDDWVRMKALDLVKAPGFGRKKPVKGKLIISKKVNEINLQTFRNHRIPLINGARSDTFGVLSTFLEKIAH